MTNTTVLPTLRKLLLTGVASSLIFAGGAIAQAQDAPPPLPAEQSDASEGSNTPPPITPESLTTLPDDDEEMPADDDPEQAGEQPVSPPPPPPPPEDEVAPPPPPPPPPELSYFLSTAGSTEGPFGRDELEARIEDGSLDEDTYVWTEGMGDWLPAGDVDEIASLLGEDATGDDQAKLSAEDDEDADAFDPAAFVVGTWVSTSEVESPDFGSAELDMSRTFTEDMRVTGDGLLYFDVPDLGSVEMEVEIDGQYAVQAIDDDEFRLTMNGETTYSAPMMGVAEETERSIVPAVIEVIDEDTMRDDEGAVWERQ